MSLVLSILFCTILSIHDPVISVNIIYSSLPQAGPNPNIFPVTNQVCGTTTFEIRNASQIKSPSGKLSRIVNGFDAEPYSIPWQVAIKKNGSHHCGGSLIHNRYILTAAHCVAGIPTMTLTVILGAYDIVAGNESSQVHSDVKKWIIHPNYNELTHHFDIALLELSVPVELNDYINTICLDTKAPKDDAVCLISGWGRRSTVISNPSNTLQQAFVPITNALLCNDSNHYYKRIDNTMTCAGYEDGGQDSCQGDSGGPLVCFDSSNNKWSQVGVVSWGDGCGEPRRPGVYSKVQSAYLWIVVQLLIGF